MQKLALAAVATCLLLMFCCTNQKPEHVGDQVGTTGHNTLSYQNEELVIYDDELVKRGLSELEIGDFVDVASVFSVSERQRVTEITLYNMARNITSWEGVSLFPNIRYIRLNSTKLSSLSELQSNTIAILILCGSNIKMIDSPILLPNLESLMVIDSNISIFPDLSNLSKLIDIDFSRTSINRIDASRVPKSVKHLYLYGTPIDSLLDISSTFSFVERIDLTNSMINSLDDIDDFGVLKQVGLFMNPVMEKFRDSDGNIPQYVEYKGVTLYFIDPEW